MNQKGSAELAALNSDFAAWRKLSRRIDRVLLAALLTMAAIACALLISGWRSEHRGIVEADPRDFAALLAMNPDTVAWLTIDGTPIDHPVVQGKDNFEYLNKGFEGGFYEGGTLFLDAGNDGDFSDPCSIIHGHHMAGRAMFSSLDGYLKRSFFDRHQKGRLLTPDWDYDLKLLAAGVYNAYDGRLYGEAAAGKTLPAEIIKEALHINDSSYINDSSSIDTQILALSTCTGEANDDRIVVFWEMTDRREHETSK